MSAPNAVREALTQVNAMIADYRVNGFLYSGGYPGKETIRRHVLELRKIAERLEAICAKPKGRK